MGIELGKDGRPARNFKTGVFLKGHIPHNAGKKWDEWLPKDKQEKILEIGKKNLHVNKALWGWGKKAVVAVNDNGEYRYCESAAQAARILNLCKRNISSCCHGRRKKCGGYRWFFYDNNEWVEYVRGIKGKTEMEIKK